MAKNYTKRFEADKETVKEILTRPIDGGILPAMHYLENKYPDCPPTSITAMQKYAGELTDKQVPMMTSDSLDPLEVKYAMVGKAVLQAFDSMKTELDNAYAEIQRMKEERRQEELKAQYDLANLMGRITASPQNDQERALKR